MAHCHSVETVQRLHSITVITGVVMKMLQVTILCLCLRDVFSRLRDSIRHEQVGVSIVAVSGLCLIVCESVDCLAVHPRTIVPCMGQKISKA